MFDIWMRLLAQIDGSVLWLLEGNRMPTICARRRRRAASIRTSGLRAQTAPEQHLARHQLADLFLDTLPYNAHTTSSDALWAGVPVITCYGNAFPGRVAASLLRRSTCRSWSTRDLADYEALALELADNPALLKATSQKLARNRLTTPLYDSERFRQNIEAAYKKMLRPNR